MGGLHSLVGFFNVNYVRHCEERENCIFV